MNQVGDDQRADVRHDKIKNVSSQNSGQRGRGRIHKPEQVGNDEFKDEDEVCLLFFCVKILPSHLTTLLR